jgi:hypothetical protein
MKEYQTRFYSIKRKDSKREEGIGKIESRHEVRISLIAYTMK